MSTAPGRKPSPWSQRKLVLINDSYDAAGLESSAWVGADVACVLDGGISGYISVGGDVVRGRARWSMERQVRLVAAARDAPVIIGSGLGLVLGVLVRAARRWVDSG